MVTTGRQLIEAVLRMADIDRPVRIDVDGEGPLEVVEVVWGPNDMLLAGGNLQGEILIRRRE